MLLEVLRRLSLKRALFLKSTNVIASVSRLRKHPNKEISGLAEYLVTEWERQLKDKSEELDDHARRQLSELRHTVEVSVAQAQERSKAIDEARSAAAPYVDYEALLQSVESGAVAPVRASYIIKLRRVEAG